MPIVQSPVCEQCGGQLGAKYVFQCDLCGAYHFCSLECVEAHQNSYDPPCGDGDPEPDVPSNFTNYGTVCVASGGSIRVNGSAGIL